jgi:hypothetical protein
VTRSLLFLLSALMVAGCKGPTRLVGHGRWMTRDHSGSSLRVDRSSGPAVARPDQVSDQEPAAGQQGPVMAFAGPHQLNVTAGTGPPLRAVPPMGHTRTTPVPSPTGAEDEEPENLMPRKRWNRLAIPAFVLAGATLYIALTSVQTTLVLLLAGLTLLVAGIALRRIRNREQAGKGFALIALLVGVIALLLTSVAIAVYGFV